MSNLTPTKTAERLEQINRLSHVITPLVTPLDCLYILQSKGLLSGCDDFIDNLHGKPIAHLLEQALSLSHSEATLLEAFARERALVGVTCPIERECIHIRVHLATLKAQGATVDNNPVYKAYQDSLAQYMALKDAPKQ
jgi:hypothetical protein